LQKRIAESNGFMAKLAADEAKDEEELARLRSHCTRDESLEAKVEGVLMRPWA